MKKFLSVLLASLFLMAFVSVGQAATGNFSWVINTLNADSTPANVAGTVTKIYFSTTTPVTTAGTLIFTSAAGATSATAVNVAGAVACGTTYYFASTSTADGQTSIISDTVSSSYACGVPGKPTLNPVILFK
jgi:hypothetical protein